MSEAESFGSSHNIKINVRYVDSNSDYYNNNVAVGLIGNQSLHSGVLLSAVSELTVYVVNSKPSENTSDERKKAESDNNTNNNDNTETTESKTNDEDIIKGLLE